MHKIECPNCKKERVINSNAALWYAKHHSTWCRSCAVKYKYPNTKRGSAKKLLEESYESYYWLGFLCADGHFAANGRLKLSLCDEDSIRKFCDFLEIDAFISRKGKEIHHKDIHEVTLMDTDYVLPLMEKYKISPRKTYNPVDFSTIKGLRNKISFIAGFIDGDGSIRNLHNRIDFNLTIKVHKSWENVLKQMGLILRNNDKVHYYKNYVMLCIGDSVLLKKLKRIVLKLDLPIMQRKWDIIDLNFIGRDEKALKTKKIVIQMLKKGFSQKEICNTLNIHNSRVSIINKKFLNETKFK